MFQKLKLKSGSNNGKWTRGHIPKGRKISTKIEIKKHLLSRGCQNNTEAAALVVIVRSTITGARVGSTVEVCVRQGSRSMVPPAF